MNWSTSNERSVIWPTISTRCGTFDSLIGEDGEVGADELLESIGHVLVDGVRDLTERLDQRLATAVLKDAGGLRKLLGQGGDIRNKLPGIVRSIARTTVINLMKTLDAADMMFARQRDVDNDSATLAESLASARPRLMRCGGSKRLLVMLPSGSTHVRPLEILHEADERDSVGGREQRRRFHPVLRGRAGCRSRKSP